MPLDAVISGNIQQVRRRLTTAAHRANRDPAHITLVVVSKNFSPEAIRSAVAAGQRVFGENRVQEALPKIDELRDRDLEWHLIGHLQSNKAKKAAAACQWIESVDSIELVRKLDAAAVECGSRPSVLVQVDLAGEATKHGVREDEVRVVVETTLASSALTLRGLMTVPPYPDAPEDSRPWFRRLRELRDQLVADGVPAEHLRELSMGMSHDFEVAIEEGSTIVRVGTAIFGERHYPATPAA